MRVAIGKESASNSREKEFVKDITPQEKDYSQWYQDVVLKAEMMDYAPIKGCMVIRPYGYAIWEKMQGLLDRRIKETGHENAYFPLLIPESLLQKEADHVEGFAPEVAWVTRGGNEDLPEKLVIRPTSEAIICSMYARWIQSWRDLPLMINQWCNVVRWEKSTRPFLRTSEFLWQEGHTAHRTEEEAEEESLRMLDVYQNFVETELAIPVLKGRKTEKEKFAGALRTYTIEALMSDGKALQAGTSHNLGQHFARVFDITFLDQDDERKYVWQTSWGVSTRLIGAVIMVHGDSRGLKLPPRLSPVQVVIVPIITKKEQEAVLQKAQELCTLLAGRVRVKLDRREGYSAGWKFNEWEMKGVPLRLEIGPRDLVSKQVVLVRRDTGQKEPVPLDKLENKILELLDEIQMDMFRRAQHFLREHTNRIEDYSEFQRLLEEKRGFIRAPWCGDPKCEARIKEETKATIRCLPFDGNEEPIPACLCCKRPGKYLPYFARSY